MPEPLEPSHAPPSPDAAPQALIRSLELDQPLRWLALAWRDMARCGWLSIAHGVLVALAGMALVAFSYNRFWLLAGLISAFMVVAPLLATSLYALSRGLEQGERPSIDLIVRTWTSWQYARYRDRESYWCLVRFGLLLGLTAVGWVLTSAAFITLLSPQPIHTPADFVRHVMLADDHWVFEAWLGLGALLAAPMFASSVVTIPLLLDRRLTARGAITLSWQAVLANPLPMALWAFLLMGFTLLGIGSAMLGLVLVVPMLGHGSWHAYRDLVDARALEPRLPPGASMVPPSPLSRRGR